MAKEMPLKDSASAAADPAAALPPHVKLNAGGADADPLHDKLMPSHADAEELDLEAGDALFPGISVSENARRWGFIQKVYGIVGLQLVLTAAVGSWFAVTPSLQLLFLGNPWTLWVAVLAPLILLFPLWVYRQSHPLNLALLALWTCSLAVTTGLICSTYQGAVVAEALVLTAAVVLSLTAYTFYAVKRGADFSFLGPMLFSALICLVVWSLIRMFVYIPEGGIAGSVYSLVGAILFSFYIVYDTDNLIKRFSYDEFVWASVNLYLDIINLFLYILRILNRFR